MASWEQTCIVCEQSINHDNVAPGIHPGDYVLCKDCDKITPDRRQAEAHWMKRYQHWARQTRIKEAAQEAYDHLAFLNQHRMLTVGGLMVMEQLKKALE